MCRSVIKRRRGSSSENVHVGEAMLVQLLPGNPPSDSLIDGGNASRKRVVTVFDRNQEYRDNYVRQKESDRD